MTQDREKGGDKMPERLCLDCGIIGVFLDKQLVAIRGRPVEDRSLLDAQDITRYPARITAKHGWGEAPPSLPQGALAEVRVTATNHHLVCILTSETPGINDYACSVCMKLRPRDKFPDITPSTKSRGAECTNNSALIVVLRACCVFRNK